MKIRKLKIELCISCLSFLFSQQPAQADLFGGDVVVLTQILAETIIEIGKIEQIIGKTSDTVNILQDMNSGVKEVLRLAETAHVTLPANVYQQARRIDQAANTARDLYGVVSTRSPLLVRNNFRSGTEALSLSEDAFDYSSFLDNQGELIKRSSLTANQRSATRLTAEALGVILQSVNHSNRIQAKALELSSTDKLAESAKEGARYETFENTHQKFSEDLNQGSFSSLNSLGD